MEVELSKLIVPPSSSQCLFPIGQLFAETNGTTLQNALQRDFPMVQLFAETKGTTGKRSKKMYPEKDIFAQGTFCQIRKHARIGCAIVHFVAKDLQVKRQQRGGCAESLWHSLNWRKRCSDDRWSRSDAKAPHRRKYMQGGQLCHLHLLGPQS
eukprot:TRINITY_DN13477_c1_g1_i1.p1 TRINITY_DN13477_c1_g1~~TRINITY_DN13477_c1_g1_i1.p1  ORF type:complete len:153 (+),score=19.16 TRINITY_DN13477_c1_g1_i1:94-552(+)